MEIYNSFEEYKMPKILFYDIKTGETLFDYTLDDYIKDNSEEDENIQLVQKTSCDENIHTSCEQALPMYDENIHSSCLNHTSCEKALPIYDETASSETASSETASSETASSETASSETASSETASSETASSETASSETTSSETASSENIHSSCLYNKPCEQALPIYDENIHSSCLYNKPCEQTVPIYNESVPYDNVNKSYFLKLNSSNGIINVLKRPVKKSIDVLKNKYIEKIILFNDKEINTFAKIYVSKKKFINNPSTIYYTNGNIYRGEMNRNLQKSGFGTLYFANGDKLTIEWQKDNAEGFGSYLYFNGDQFNGYWINNIYQDNPILTIYPNNESFYGYLLNDKKQGYGVYTWPNGSSYKGMWNNDLYHGYGILDYRDNNGYSFIYEGNWFNGSYIFNIENTY